MDYNTFKQAVVEQAERLGITEYDLYYSGGASTSVSVFEKEIDDFSDVQSIGICFRCVIDGKTGYASTQNLCREQAEDIVKRAAECAGIIESADPAYIYAGSDSYPAPMQHEGTGCDVARLKSMALSLEEKAFALDSRVTSVAYSVIDYSTQTIGIYNSKGLDLIKHMQEYSGQLMLSAQQGERKYSGSGYQGTLDVEALNLDSIAEEAVGLAVNSIGGKAPASGKYPVILSARVAASLLRHFSGIFSGDAVLKGISLLKNKEGEKIASDIVTFYDDPHCPESSGKTHFDDEGVATFRKNIIEKGVLKTLLYDLSTAGRVGGQSTGNGRKAGYSGSVQIAPFTVGLETGEYSLSELMKKAGKGLYVTEIKGLHASADAATGDFSLESKGQFFDNGAVVNPAEQFTIAGNFYSLLKNISAVGSKAVLSGGALMPEILISELAISGE